MRFVVSARPGEPHWGSPCGPGRRTHREVQSSPSSIAPLPLLHECRVLLYLQVGGSLHRRWAWAVQRTAPLRNRRSSIRSLAPAWRTPVPYSPLAASTAPPSCAALPLRRRSRWRCNGPGIQATSGACGEGAADPGKTGLRFVSPVAPPPTPWYIPSRNSRHRRFDHGLV